MKVAIAGYGTEGEVSYQYWASLGADVTIFDQAIKPTRPIPSEADARLGEDMFADMNGYDLVIRTASLNPKLIHTDGKVWSATNEFFAKCPAPIIGVTGTKGKGTTCTLISEILKAAGKTVHLVGNIGTPALDVLPKIDSTDLVVFELSSFQLWDIEKSPETAVILMIEPDHLNVHVDMDDYVMAKANIGRFQSSENLIVYHPSNKDSARAALVSPAQKKRYMTNEGAYLRETRSIIIGDNTICDISEVGLMGTHNLENICAAVTVAWSYTKDVTAIKHAVTTFKGLPHRIELVREVDNVRYFDDSYSANPAATIAAIHTFTQPLILIAGGFDRGADFTELTSSIVQCDNLKVVILIGETAERIASLLDARGYHKYVVSESRSFTDIISIAQSKSLPGDTVLLSPGCPSFDMFKNFEERGTQFKKIIREL